MIGYDITITNATTPLPTNQDPPSSLDCITKYTANADLSLLDYERNKLNQPNCRTAPPISGDDVTGNLLHNQMILTLVAIDAHRRIGPMLSISKLLCLWHTPTSSIPPQKQFKPNRPNNEKACTNSQLPFQPLLVAFSLKLKQINSGNNFKQNINNKNKNSVQTESFSSFNTIIVNNNNPTTWTRHCSCLQHTSKSYKKLVYSPNSPGQPLTSTISSYNYRFTIPRKVVCR